METLNDEVNQQYRLKQRRIGLYILKNYPVEALLFFDMLGIPTKDFDEWQDALERTSQNEAIPAPTERITTLESAAVAIPSLGVYSRPGDRNGMAKISDKIVLAVRHDYDTHNYANLKELGKRYGISRQTVAGIGHRQTWTHVPETTKEQ